MNTLTGKAKAFQEDTVPGWVTCIRCGGTMPRENMDAHKCIYAKQDNAAAARARIAEMMKMATLPRSAGWNPIQNLALDFIPLLRIAEAAADGDQAALTAALEAFGKGE